MSWESLYDIGDVVFVDGLRTVIHRLPGGLSLDGRVVHSPPPLVRPVRYRERDTLEARDPTLAPKGTTHQVVTTRRDGQWATLRLDNRFVEVQVTDPRAVLVDRVGVTVTANTCARCNGTGETPALFIGTPYPCSACAGTGTRKDRP